MIRAKEKDLHETNTKKKKRPRYVSWWDDFKAFDELSCVVKGLPKAKENDAATSCVDLHQKYTKKKKDDERPFSSSHRDNFKCEDDERSTESNNKKDQDRVGSGHVSLEDLGVSVEDLKSMSWEAFVPTWEVRSKTMPSISWPSFSTTATDLDETKTNKKEDG
ncbi:unnamed protein product [Thlaspi arvense]|uniref:Uncharacterized protein n=1 Tax=Thlaspi arvense TaxID=13288 RepID=A0AAU9RRN7_THLAR|nr:unnamed protein product [Thlaspi arvense]